MSKPGSQHPQHTTLQLKLHFLSSPSYPSTVIVLWLKISKAPSFFVLTNKTKAQEQFHPKKQTRGGGRRKAFQNVKPMRLPLSSLRPSCPNLLRPQPKTAPERVSAKLCAPPAAIWAKGIPSKDFISCGEGCFFNS